MSRLVRSIRVLLPLLTIALAGALTSCGDDSTPQGPDGSTSGLSGHFVDSYVQGLSYASGSTTGSTGANGKFFFERIPTFPSRWATSPSARGLRPR